MSTLRSIKNTDIAGKVVLLRVDYNVPVHEGKILDFTRIDASLPSLRHLISGGAKVLIVSHFGRPGGKRDAQFSLEFLTKPLTDRLGSPVLFCPNIAEMDHYLKLCHPGKCILLENIRFEEGEEKDDANLAKTLAQYCDLYVNDAFSCAHRNHASTHAIANLLPSYAGISLLSEVENLDKALKNDSDKTVIIVAGKKVSTKFKVLQNLATKCSHLIIGGAMANTFHQALGLDMGKSYVETEFLPEALNFYQKYKDKLVLPKDYVCLNGEQIRTLTPGNLTATDSALDVGEQSIAVYKNIIASSSTLLWNGPLGYFEDSRFATATLEICKFTSELTRSNKLYSVAGGGDTVAALALDPDHTLSYISTAGGAFLEYLEGMAFDTLKKLR